MNDERALKSRAELRCELSMKPYEELNAFEQIRTAEYLYNVAASIDSARSTATRESTDENRKANNDDDD